jgi:hypothetical protein
MTSARPVAAMTAATPYIEGFATVRIVQPSGLHMPRYGMCSLTRRDTILA